MGDLRGRTGVVGSWRKVVVFSGGAGMVSSELELLVEEMGPSRLLLRFDFVGTAGAGDVAEATLSTRGRWVGRWMGASVCMV